jgi:hypothetical protein
MGELLTFIAITAAVGAVLLLVVTGSVRALRWARKGSPAAAFIGWALLLLGAGMNPQPPPQEQVEEANRQKRIKKDAESADPES